MDAWTHRVPKPPQESVQMKQYEEWHAINKNVEKKPFGGKGRLKSYKAGMVILIHVSPNIIIHFK